MSDNFFLDEEEQVRELCYWATQRTSLESEAYILAMAAPFMLAEIDSLRLRLTLACK